MGGSIEQTFVSLEDGIPRLTLPLPTGPKHVHCYLAGGTLFDTGLGLSDGPRASSVYPGHGEPIPDAAARARELIDHHRLRLDDTVEALGDEPRSA